MKRTADFEQRVIRSLNKVNSWGYIRIMDKYAEELSGYAIAHDISKETAHALTMDTFHQLWVRLEGRKAFDNFRSVRAFLMKTIRSLVSKHHRFLVRECSNMYRPFSTGLITRCHKVVEDMPGAARQVFKLEYFKGMSDREIAVRLKVTEREVLKRKMEALTLIRRHRFLVASFLLEPSR